MIRKTALVMVFVTLSASGALAQGTVTDGALTFTFNADIAGPFAGNANLAWEGVDQLYQWWWWYRINGDAFETPMPVPDTQYYNGQFVILEWTDVDGRGFDATLQVYIGDCRVPFSCYYIGQGAYGLATSFFSLTNQNPGPLDFELFVYADIDVAGSSADDSADSLSFFSTEHTISISEANKSVVFNTTLDQVAFKVTPFEDLRNDLTDADVDDLDGSGLPFAPGDFTGAFQFGVQVGAGETVIFLSDFYINFPFFADSFEIGNTSNWSDTVPPPID
jgi:hypothetical protein